MYRDLGLAQKLTKSDTPLKSYSGHPIVVQGTVVLPVSYKGQTFRVKFYIVDVKASPVLSAETCKELNLVKTIHEISQQNINKQFSNKLIDIKNDYPELCEGLGCLPGEYSIKLQQGANPVIHPPRKVPIALKDSIKAELDRMEAEGVVVKVDEPTEWVNSMVTVVKPNGQLRICIDPKDLNKVIEREHYPMKTLEEVVGQMAGAKVFSVLDAKSGFWQIRLDEASSKLRTFNTPFGRYRFTRLPFGIKSAPEVFQRVIARMLETLSGVDSIMDDIIVWGNNVEQHDERLREVLERAKSHQLRLSLKKCKIRQSEVSYVGHLLTADGVRADPEKVRAVIEMEQPKDISEVQRFLGFIQYLSKFLPSLSDESAPLRKLVEKDTAWHWGKSQEDSFHKLKQLASSTPVLRYYDVRNPVTLSVDASCKGLGAVLLQEGKPVAYASRALTSVQQQYAQIDKELLAIVYGCKKFHQYVYGREVEVETDHKPLQSIFKKPLHQAPSRLQKMLLQLQSYDLTVTYKSGKEMYLADTLSRSNLNESRETLVADLDVNMVNVAMSPEKCKEFQDATSRDPVLNCLKRHVLEGWPDDQIDCPLEIRSYWTFKEDISYQDGLLFKSDKVIVPKVLRSEMLSRIHESHLGINKCKQRARELLFWPGMSTQIEELVARCEMCATHRPINSREPMIVSESPSRPWEMVGCDLFEFRGNYYLVCVDYYSKWPEIARLDDLSSKTTVTHLKSMFARYGIPDVVRSDNGPQFASQVFEDFQKSYGFKHLTSSPRFPQSNGKAERAVQTVKNLLKKAQDPYKALLDYRSTPLEGIGFSPSQLLMSRRLKTTLPVKKSLLLSENATQVKNALDKCKLTQKQNYDRWCSQELPPLKIGQKVRLQKDKVWVPATVVSKHKTPRSYIITDHSGSIYRRNRRHLRESQSANIPEESNDLPFQEFPDDKNRPLKKLDNTSKEPSNMVRTRSGRISVPPNRYQSV